MSYLKSTFSVNRYDSDGDIYEDGIFLEFDHFSIRICDGDIESFDNFIMNLSNMRKHILENILAKSEY